jgi:3-dehydroquinate dehydratase
MIRRTALATLLTVLAMPALGCATEGSEPGTDARAAEGPLVGHVIEFALEPDALDHDRIDEIAKRIEAITAAETMQIKVEKSDEDGTVVIAEAWGRTAIQGDAIVKDLRATFPQLTNAVIAVKTATGEPPSAKIPEIEVELDGIEDTEEVRQKVLAKLRAQGIEGDVTIDVDENEDGKREIRVQVAKEEKQIAPH